jgi:hypothetical protein
VTSAPNRTPVVVVGDRAPQRRSEEADRRRPRRRLFLYVAGGLLGPGWWLCGAVYDGPPSGKTSVHNDLHFAEFVVASGIVVLASWGLLLILGEAMLFALAVVKADDRERYDIYRNLMILWGYVLTLGIPRHFRRLPAQFGASPEDDEPVTPRCDPEKPAAARTERTTGKPAPRTREDGTRDDATPDPAVDEDPGPAACRGAIGPIFPRPPRTPPAAPAAAVTLPPSGEAEFQNALDLLLKYAARFAREDPPAGGGAAFGYSGETGGDP